MSTQEYAEPALAATRKESRVQQKRRPSAGSENIGRASEAGVLEHKRRYVPQTSTHNVPHPAADRRAAAAASVIQRAWRRSRVRQAVAAWQRTGVSVVRLKDLGFDAAARLMRTADVVQSSAKLVQALLLTAPTVDDADARACKAPGRVFVTGFLFAAHGQLLVTGNSHMDAMVVSAAETMTKTYAEFTSEFRDNTVSWYEQQQTFVVSFMAFNAAFDSWKRSDSQQLLATMERHYLELDRLWQTVQRRVSGDGEEESWRLGIQDQREDLLKKIRMLGGDTAVDSMLQRQRELRSTYQNLQPSQTPSLPSAGVADDQNEASVESDQPSVLLTKAILDPKSQDVDRILGSYNLTASSALENAKIAHELIIDPEIRLEAGAASGKVVDALIENAQKGIGMIQLLEQLRVELRTVIPPSNPMHKSLDTEFDAAWMESQLKHNALDIPSRLQLALQMIRSVCAPIRDDNVSALQKRVEDIDDSTVANAVDVLRDIFALINQLRVDVLNYQLDTVVRPWLRTHAVEYEREKMAQTLDVQCGDNSDRTVEVTTGWMRPAAARIQSEQPPGSRDSFASRVFKEALLDLLFAPTALTPQTAPVTLALDQARIQGLQNEIQVLLSTGALCALVKGMLRRHGSRPSDSELRQQVAPAIQECLRSEDVNMDAVIQTVADAVRGQGNSVDEEQLGRLVRKTLTKDDPVYRAMEGGLRKCIRAQIDKGVAPDAQQHRTELARLSLAVVYKEICVLEERICRLSEFNWQVHSPWYAKIGRMHRG
ncbi:hypothetical protein IWW51_000768 [Coemansia sp. RSA 2702]|nr:hypothetical protein IWW51_000768 [Coemansia sp. RSA 2702]